MKKVFVVISDKTYLNHAKYLLSSAKNDGKWEGDFCLIANNIDSDDNELLDFKKFGTEIIHINDNNYYFANFHVFDKKMKKWDYVMSMDCDFTIFGNLNDIIDVETMKKNVISMDKEPFKIHEYFCQGWNQDKKNESLSGLYEKYDLNREGFNAGFLSFNTNLINDDTLNDLICLSNQLKYINNHACDNGSDQPIFNLYFIDKIIPIENKKISYWKESNDNTIAQHHCRWDAPWHNNTFSHRLNKTYSQNYNENLNKFICQ